MIKLFADIALPGLGWLNQLGLAGYFYHGHSTRLSWTFSHCGGVSSWVSNVVVGFPTVSILRDQSGSCKSSSDLISNRITSDVFSWLKVSHRASQDLTGEG